MRRIRVTGRFYIFVLALLVIAFLILRPLLFRGTRETVIMMANASQRQTVDCVIIRDETVTVSDSAARVEALNALNYENAVTGTIVFDEIGDAKKDVAYIKQANTETGASFDFVKIQTIADL